MKRQGKIGVFICMSIILVLSMLGISQIKLEATSKDHVIYTVDWISDHSAEIELKWSNPATTTPIMVVSWASDKDGYVKVKYKQGTNIVQGFSKRLISGDDINFPCIILLEEDLGKNSEIKTPFPDLPLAGEENLAILHLYHLGVLGGYLDGTIRPNGNLTRAEFSKILFEAGNMTYSTQETAQFSDVSSTYWAKEYINTLAVKKIVNGKGNNRFDPNGTITIGEVIAIIERSFLLEDKKIVYTSELFTHWSNENFLSLVSEGIIIETDSYYLSYTPSKIASREECAVLISRILKQYHEVIK